MKIAILTGASSGLGIEFYKALQKENLDEIWVIARRKERLESLAKEGAVSTRVLAYDLTDRATMESLSRLLAEEKPDVKFLINNAGFGVIGNVDGADYTEQGKMVELNDRALVEITTVVLKYMKEKSFIINTCSIASFVPNARMSVYSATKAFVMSYSRSLRYELKEKKINVTAVCPGPMKTEFLKVAGIEKGVSKNFDTLPYCNPQTMAQKGLDASKRGKAVYTQRFLYKFFRLVAKILPTSWLLRAVRT